MRQLQLPLWAYDLPYCPEREVTQLGFDAMGTKLQFCTTHWMALRSTDLDICAHSLNHDISATYLAGMSSDLSRFSNCHEFHLRTNQSSVF
jgi:hypothetical protein